MPRILLNARYQRGGAPRPPRPSPRSFHARLPGYEGSPLVRAAKLETVLGLSRIWVKDESSRLGLPAFKILGASWAVYRTASAMLGSEPAKWTSIDELRDCMAPLRPLRLATAPDGNHGRAVARVARLLGFDASIFMPAGTAEARIRAIEGEGAKVTVVDGSYDDAVERAKKEAGPRCLVVSDTSWEGYTDIPSGVAEGYETIFEETDERLAELGEQPPTHVFVQIGVGALAVAAVNHYRGRATLIGVEPDGADCVLRSAEAGRIVSVPGPHRSIMAGLNCGMPSLIAWPVMRDGIVAFVAVGDERATQAMRALAADGLVSGETGASGAAGLIELFNNETGRSAFESLGLSQASRVLLLSTEGATDPEFYRSVVGEPA